jgi:hypothetical protein
VRNNITRRDLLRGAAAGLLLFDGSRASLAGQKRVEREEDNSKREKDNPTRFLSGANLYQDLIAYYNLGEHRTATEVDIKTSDWLAAGLRGAGLPTMFQKFSLGQFFLKQNSLSVAGKHIRCFPLWPPRPTGPTPVHAPLAEFQKTAGPENLKGRIALVRFPFDPRAAVFKGSGHAQIINEAAKAGAVAVIAVTEGVTGEIIALNVDSDADTWPIPLALACPRDEPHLADAARLGRAASLVIDGEYDSQAEAKNVLGRVVGEKGLIVVSTPQSGWFRSAGERGPGIALFLGLARWASRRKSGTSFLFISTSGHELGGLGMKAFQKELAPPPERVLCWLHLGAGIATWAWEETSNGLKRLRQPDSNRYLMSSDELAPLLETTFAGLAGLRPNAGRAVGELDLVKRAGYRAFGIAASHRFHHTPADSPDMTAPVLLEPVARALVKTLEAVESKPQG